MDEQLVQPLIGRSSNHRSGSDPELPDSQPPWHDEREFTSQRLELSVPRRPRFRKGMAEVMVGDKLFLFGGLIGEGCWNDLWSFSMDKQKWEEIEIQLDDRPNPRFGASLAATEDQKDIYLYGGAIFVIANGSKKTSTLNDLWKFDTESKQWTLIHASLDRKEWGRAGHISVIRNRKLIVCGGCSTSPSLSRLEFDTWEYLHVFELAKATWTKIRVEGEAPKPRLCQAWAMHNNMVYIHGGECSKYNVLSGFFVLDLKRNIWTKTLPQGTPPSARTAHCCCFHGSRLYLHGGRNPQSGEYFDDLFVYDLDCNHWSKVKRGGGEFPNKSVFMVGKRNENNSLYVFEVGYLARSNFFQSVYDNFWGRVRLPGLDLYQFRLETVPPALSPKTTSSLGTYRR